MNTNKHGFYRLCPGALVDNFESMNLAANLESIRLRIKAACDRSDREPNSVTLLAVTKTQPPETVGAAAGLGLTGVRRKQGAGSEGENSIVPRQVALAFHRPSAIEQMPRRRAVVPDDPGRGQPVAGAGDQQAGGRSGEDDAGLARSQSGGRGEQVRLQAGATARGVETDQCVAHESRFRV